MAAQHTPHLYIVEDDEAWIELLSTKLEGRYTISKFATGEAAVQALVSLPPDVVILDYHLAGTMTGKDVLKKIHKECPNAYVVAFSQQDDVQIAVDILDGGAFDYVVKGDNALNRLNIVLRNIESRQALSKELIDLSIKIQKDRFWLGMFVLGILVMSFFIYINTCPEGREWQWDPFDRASADYCRDNSKKNFQ